MITSATKARLLIFVVLTLIGVAYVGGRYAQVDRIFVDRSYDVRADFAESGGIFVGADVTYRGVSVGRVSDLELSEDGVDATLTIENSAPEVPSDLTAVVANKSAIGEQYVDLQPKSDSGPYLADGSTIDQADTRTPLSTQDLLSDAADFVGSVNTKDLRTVVHELGVGFDGTGHDLSKIVDTSNSFIETANDNFGVTARLIHESTTVLDGQLASESSIRSFSRDLADFSQTLSDSDPDIRTVLDETPDTVDEIGALLDENKLSFAQLIDNLSSLNRVALAHLPGIRGVLVLAPYAVENGYSVLSKNPRTGKYEIRLSIATSPKPDFCDGGYVTPQQLPIPSDVASNPLIGRVCSDPAATGNVRGVQNATSPPGATVGLYDPATKSFSTDVPDVPDGLGRPAPRTDDDLPGSWTRLMVPSVGR